MQATKTFLFASDFDQTLSFNDSGHELAKLMGISDFPARVAALAERNLVQQGGELAYLLLHDADFRAVRREHLVEAGKRVHLKDNIALLARLLNTGLPGFAFPFYVISAAPQEVVQSALAGIVEPHHIIGTRFSFNAKTGQVDGILQVPAGYGKVAALAALQKRLGLSEERIIYAGDGQSDIHVMLHIGRRKGYTLAVSQAEAVTSIARRTVLSEDALSVLIPVLEDICGWDASQIRTLFEANQLIIQAWAKMRTDVLTIAKSP